MKTVMDNWELTLLALYAGAVSGMGFNDVTARWMEIPEQEFGWTLYIMQMRGVIEGCLFQPPRPGDPDQPMKVNRDALILTPKGFERAEAMLAAQSDGERLDEIYRLMKSFRRMEMAKIIYDRINNVASRRA